MSEAGVKFFLGENRKLFVSSFPSQLATINAGKKQHVYHENILREICLYKAWFLEQRLL